MGKTDIYRQLLWLVDVIRSAGTISKAELDTQWAKSPLNTKHERHYPIRSFHRHRQMIEKMFGLYITCEKGNSLYRLSNESEFQNLDFRKHLTHTLAFATQLLEATDLQRRVLFEPHDDGTDCLPGIVNALKTKHVAQVTFKPETGLQPKQLVPYFVKEHNHHWYLAAKQYDSEEEARVYDMSTLAGVVLTRDHASMPRWFSADAIFNDYFERLDRKRPKKEAKEVKPKETKAPEKQAKVEAPKAPVAPQKAPKPAPQMPEQLSLF